MESSIEKENSDACSVFLALYEIVPVKDEISCGDAYLYGFVQVDFIPLWNTTKKSQLL
jgi:hypothetical protein